MLRFQSLKEKLSAVLLLVAAVASAETPAGSGRFGFTGPEIFPIDAQISQIRSADIDGDGRLDLIVVNNARSKINLLYNQTGETNIVKRTRPLKELNELPPDARFRIESIASEKRISSLVVTDLNGDGKPDLAYYGDPKELVVQYNQGTNGWNAPKRWQVGDEYSLMANSLASGDLNGDGRTDLVLLAENHLLFLAQTADNLLAEPEKIPFTGSVKAVQILDIDGNGRDDLFLVNWDDPNPFRFRLQNEKGQLGPEIYFSMPAIRAYWADDLDGDGKTEVMTIAQNSGRAQVANFARKAAEPLSAGFEQGQFEVLPLNKTAKSRRGILWADINGDHLADLLVAEPDSGQLTLFLQKSDGTLSAPKTFPTLTGVSELAVADWNNDGKPEIFLLSLDERQVGVTTYNENGRIPFPTILPMEGKPLAMAVGVLDGREQPLLAVILDSNNSRVLLTRTADGKTTSRKLSESFKSNPASMSVHDVDQDGRPDLVVLIPYEKTKILLQGEEGEFDEHDVVPPGGNAEQPWMSRADVDGDGKPELLLAQKNFVRAVVLKNDPSIEGSTNKTTWSFSVKEQINGASSNSRIVAATPLRAGADAAASLFLLDAERKALTICQRDDSGVWQVIRNIPLPFTQFQSLQTVGLGTANDNSIAFVGVNAVAWMSLTGEVWELAPLDSYETPIKDARLNDVISGDLDNDGRKDLVFLETAKNFLDVVAFEAPHQLVPCNRWRVFEERTFRSRRNEFPEPREALIADVTGDGKNDLVVLVHDRVLVYPQE